MDFMKAMAIAASGLHAQIGRMEIISENMANADSTAQTPGGGRWIAGEKLRENSRAQKSLTGRGNLRLSGPSLALNFRSRHR